MVVEFQCGPECTTCSVTRSCLAGAVDDDAAEAEDDDALPPLLPLGLLGLSMIVTSTVPAPSAPPPSSWTKSSFSGCTCMPLVSYTRKCTRYRTPSTSIHASPNSASQWPGFRNAFKLSTVAVGKKSRKSDQLAATVSAKRCRNTII